MWFCFLGIVQLSWYLTYHLVLTSHPIVLYIIGNLHFDIVLDILLHFTLVLKMSFDIFLKNSFRNNNSFLIDS